MWQTFEVKGMTCEHCEAAVQRALKRLDKAAQVRISRAENRVEVDSEQPRAALAQAISDEGYTVSA